jgi:hypothetical protein
MKERHLEGLLLNYLETNTNRMKNIKQALMISTIKAVTKCSLICNPREMNVKAKT